MIWWFLIVAVAAGTIVWAVLSAYIQVRDRMRRSQNQHHEGGHEAETGHQQ
ncbi:MAG TPA: hypothetical protein VFA85_03075 [Terriglobales bacterium]|nr:hypothetical protein [Terriglobales bacterium]